MNHDEYCDFVMSVTGDSGKDYNVFLGTLDIINEKEYNVPQMLNSALGLAGEAAEVFQEFEKIQVSQSAVLEELGDVLWYLVQACKTWGLDFTEVMEDGTTTDKRTYNNCSSKDLVIFCGKYADFCKKIFLHAKPIEEQHERAHILLIMIATAIMDILEYCCHSLDDLMKINYEKLSKRHANGFTRDYKS